MPSPLAHVGIAAVFPLLLVWEGRFWWVFGWCAVGSLIPDLDVLPMLVSPGGIAWHRGPTHSITGALGIGMLLVWLSRRLEPRLGRYLGAGGGAPGSNSAGALAIILAVLSHLPLDWSTGEEGAPARYGVPLFWPFSDQKYIATRPWFGAFGIDGEGGLNVMFSREVVRIYGGELLTVFVAISLALLSRRAWRRATAFDAGQHP